MHPLALGAFCRRNQHRRGQRDRVVLMHPLALGAFCLQQRGVSGPAELVS